VRSDAIPGLAACALPARACTLSASGAEIVARERSASRRLRAAAPHLVLRPTRAKATIGPMDVRRLADLLVGGQSKAVRRRVERVSPLAVSVLMNIVKESVAGAAEDSFSRRSSPPS
jgi:hypothetical protein